MKEGILEMNNNDKTIKEYFTYYDLVFGQEVKDASPLLYQEYKNIKIKISAILSEVNNNNFLSKMKELLIFDAYLQNIYSFTNFDDTDYTEPELLRQCSKDKDVYYKEAFGYRINDVSPNILLFKILDSK